MSIPKKRSSWGSIAETSRGTYVIRYHVNGPEGRKRKCETFRGTRREAETRLAELRLMHSEDAPCPTVGQAYRMWYAPRLDERFSAGELSESSRTAYTGVWRNHAEPRWGRVPLDAVRPLDVQAWLDGLGSAATARNALMVLRGVADMAVMYEACRENKFALPYSMPKGVKRRRRDVLTLAEMDALWGKLRGTIVEAPYLLAAFGGLRTGEALAVGVDSVRLEEHCGLPLALVEVRAQMGMRGHEPTSRLKNEQSRRTAIIPPPYSTRLMELCGECRGYESEWLSGMWERVPANKGQLDYRWGRDAGDPIPFQNLRNSWRTACRFDWRVPDDVAEAIMGHKLPGVTGSHYLRPGSDALADDFARAYADFAAT